jgi:hypothetical protein
MIYSARGVDQDRTRPNALSCRMDWLGRSCQGRDEIVVDLCFLSRLRPSDGLGFGDLSGERIRAFASPVGGLFSWTRRFGGWTAPAARHSVG